MDTLTLRWLIGALLLGGGLLFGRVFKANFQLSRAGKIRKTLGVFAVVFGALLIMRAAGLLGQPIHPPEEARGAVQWLSDHELALEEAKRQGRGMLLDFSAEWCKACKELEAHTFSDPAVAKQLSKWVTLRIDLTEESPALEILQQRYKVRGLPTVTFISPEGEQLEALTLTGFEEPAAFLERLGRAERGERNAEEGSLASRIGLALESGSFWVYLLIFFAGIIGSLSPCVYPLIPITISVLGGGEKISRGQGFLRSLVYVLGITTTYSVLGVLAASTGGLFGSALQSAWLVVGVSLIFLIMGVSMLGAFEIRLPARLNDRLNAVGGVGSGRFISAYLMGSVAGIIAAPCVGPPLVVVLTFVATQGQIGLGLGLLIIYSLGMGLLFILLGTFSQLLSHMPRSGGWMEVIKGSLGILMLLVGLAYLNDLFPFLP